MKRVVFLLGSYFPDFSAVGYCAYQVQKCLAEKHDLSVLAFRTKLAQPMEAEHDGIRIQRLETKFMKRRNKLQNSSGLISQARQNLMRSWGATSRLLAPETVDKALVSAYLHDLNGMERKPDVLVPIAFPIEAVLAALEFKKENPQTKVYPYLFDDFVESGSLHVLKVARKLKRKRHLNIEARILTEADTILSMHPLRRHFKENFEKPLLDKIIYLEHPLLIRPPETSRKYDASTASLCFTGSLIKKVREPDYLLRLLQIAKANIPIRVDFFVMGNDANKVKTVKIGDSVEIINHGRVPKPEANAAVQNADILVNLGEAQGNQVSSKVFEYLATGKPIVHLSYVAGDIVGKILSKYPLALCLEIGVGSLEENARLLSEFIDRHRCDILSFDEVAEIYPEALPETTAKVIVNLLEKHQEVGTSCQINIGKIHSNSGVNQ